MAGMAFVESKQQALNPCCIEDPPALQSHVLHTLHSICEGPAPLFPDKPVNGAVSSTVMLLLGQRVFEGRDAPETCIILNKRSRRVRQAGDLCCPGGSVETELDPYLAKLLSLPCSPLTNWPYWSRLREERPREAKLLSLLLATGLRESWEEMRLSPFCIRFLGPLPSQRLLLFHRVIYPMVGWVSWQKRFVPSWEVERIVTVPLRDLLDAQRYARYRLYVPPEIEEKYQRGTHDFLCFIHNEKNQTEILWGATFKIVSFFLEAVFGFKPPEMASLPLAPGLLDEGYIFGRE
jgi:8-oxo-dGTP pyrophosphatase MutT (NUDIX family)